MSEEEAKRLSVGARVRIGRGGASAVNVRRPGRVVSVTSRRVRIQWPDGTQSDRSVRSMDDLRLAAP